MKEIVMYRAEDGKLFEREEECRRHEVYLGYCDTISYIYKKYTAFDKEYSQIFEEEPQFVEEVAKVFDFEIKKTDLGINWTTYSFVPKPDCKDADLKKRAWESFQGVHYLPF